MVKEETGHPVTIKRMNVKFKGALILILQKEKGLSLGLSTVLYDLSLDS